jgi:4-amino-4-deoxy-L-arabinose transferase-like glycosyltransferase
MNELTSKSKFQVLAAWLLSLIFVSIFIVQGNYVARENDSRLYGRFTKQLNEKPLSQYLALEWRDYSPHFAETETPYVRDHLIGQFLFPVFLAKIGVPVTHAIYIANAIYKILSILLLFLIAKSFYSLKVASILTFLIQLIPVSLNYQMRANHEPALLLLVLLSIYSTINLDRKLFFTFILFFCVQFCFLIKGVAFLPLLPVILATYLINSYKDKVTLNWNKLIILGVIFLSPLLTAYLYEILFYKTTGHPFFSKYIKTQLMDRAFKQQDAGIPVIKNIKAFGYYFSRTLSYSLPWSLLALIILVKNRFKFSLEKIHVTLITGTLIYILTFSISSRTASRYIHPSYFLFSASCILYAFSKFEERIKLSPKSILIFSAVLFSVLSGLSIYKGMGNHLIFPH